MRHLFGQAALDAEGWRSLAAVLDALSLHASARANRAGHAEAMRRDVADRQALIRDATRLADKVGIPTAVGLTGVSAECLAGNLKRYRRDLDRARRMERDAIIVSLRAAGVPIDTVAAVTGLSAGRISQITRTRARRPIPGRRPPRP